MVIKSYRKYKKKSMVINCFKTAVFDYLKVNRTTDESLFYPNSTPFLKEQFKAYLLLLMKTERRKSESLIVHK